MRVGFTPPSSAVCSVTGGTERTQVPRSDRGPCQGKCRRAPPGAPAWRPQRPGGPTASTCVSALRPGALGSASARSARGRRSPPDVGTAWGQRGDSAPGQVQLGPARGLKCPQPREAPARMQRRAHTAEPRPARKATAGQVVACHPGTSPRVGRPAARPHGEPGNLRRGGKPGTGAPRSPTPRPGISGGRVHTAGAAAGRARLGSDAEGPRWALTAA